MNYFHNMKLHYARAWMRAQGIRQLGTEHLTQEPRRLPDFRDNYRGHLHELQIAQQDAE